MALPGTLLSCYNFLVTTNKQHGFAIPALVVIIAVLLIGAGAYCYNGKSMVPVVAPVAPVSPAAPAANAATPVESISVDGALKYTDESFGFSFLYPASLSVSKRSVLATSTSMFENSKIINGANTVILRVIDAPEILVYEVHSSSMSILSSVDAGPIGSAYNKYYFDTASHAWMYANDGVATGGKNTTTAADISNNTMGGLHILSGYTRFSHKVIIPLSAQNFLVVYSKCNNATDYLCDDKTGTKTTALDRFNAMVRTFSATDPSVATPVGASEQKVRVQAVVDDFAGYITPAHLPLLR